MVLRTTRDVVAEISALLAAVPEPPRGPSVVAIDGRSGSGKTDLADLLAERTGAVVVHMDDLYPGWHGLAAAVELLGEVLDAVRTGEPATHPVWDWAAGDYAAHVALPQQGLIVVEGVGSGCARDVDLLVELVADPSVRRDRALSRDGDTFAPYWDDWALQEADLFSRKPLRPDVRFVSDSVVGSVPGWS